MPFSVRSGLRALALAAMTMLVLTLPGVVTTTPSQAMPVEGYPSYQPQSKCSPRPKLGTVMLSEYLLRKYPGSGSSGISRDCAASGVSEHKEGRAFDWRLSASSARDREYAQDFLKLLLATDRQGNDNAIARRMGIMYVIWNDRIWSASHGYRERRYLHGACARVRGCSTTLRHRDHMHISLSWPGARGRTSWFVRRGAPGPAPAPVPEPAPKPEPKPDPKPEPKPEPKPQPKPQPEPRPDPTPPTRAPLAEDGIVDLRRQPYTRVVVPADGSTVETRFKVAEGVTYSLTAAGLYSFGGPDQVGDAVCTWSRRDDDWLAKPRRSVLRTYGRLALRVNGKAVFGDACRDSHTYRTELTPTRDRTLKLQLRGKHPSSRGRITVVVGRKRAKVAPALPDYPELTPAPTYSTVPRIGFGLLGETVRVPASREGATYTRESLEPGAVYRVTVSGAVGLGNGVRADGRCISVRGTWYDAASIDPRVPQQDHGHLYLNGVPFNGTPSNACGSGTQSGEYVADTRSRLRLDLWDPLERSDNSGELTVTVQRLSAVPTPVAADRERKRPRQEVWQLKRDDLTVAADRARGTVSSMRLRRGDRVQIHVSGRITSGAVAADASCVRRGGGWSATDPLVQVADALNLWVDGQAVRWRTVGARSDCSPDATYTTRFTATKNGPLRLAVFDLDHRDNTGELTVTMKRLKG